MRRGLWSAVPPLLVWACLGLALRPLPALGQGGGSAADDGREAAAVDGVSAPGGAVLRVGTKSAPPFAIQRDDGSWTGISIDLWQQLAGQLGVAYEIEERSLDDLFAGLEDGSLDLAVAALTMTADREAVVDFSHPFFTSGLAIAVHADQRSGWWGVLQRFVSWKFLRVLLVLAGVLAVIGTIIWLVERRRNPDQFGGGVAQGLGSGLWWSAVTMTTVGYGDKAPSTFAGRLLALLWMFASLVVISSFTAAITSSLTVSELGSKVRGPDDLPRVRTVTLASTTSHDYLSALGVAPRLVGSLDEALDLLGTDEADAVVYDAPLLAWASRRHGRDLELLPHRFEDQPYGIALPTGSDFREPLNRAILATTDDPSWDRLVRSYLGE